MTKPGPGSTDTPKALIAGGGVAGIEAMLALRDLAGDRVEVELHAPSAKFAYRPLSVGEPFGAGRAIEFDLEDLTSRAGASFCLDTVASVDGAGRRVATRDGDEIPYDYLLLAPGVRMLWAIPGAVTFWGVPDEGGAPDVVRRLREGELSRVVFTMPGGVGRPMPIYELALLAEAEVARSGRQGVKLTIVTPEDLPLGMFGRQAGEKVAELLAERGIETIVATHPVMFDGKELRIAPGSPIEADAVISTPRMEGRPIAGVPHDPSGFVPIDEHGRVLGLERVYAAGDVTAFPVKQGGIATQQADAAAEAIAADLGVGLDPAPFDPVLRATLWTGKEPRFLYGRPTGGHGEASVFSDHAIWEHEGKIVGRYLAPFLDSIPGAERPGSQSGQSRAT